MSIFRRWTSGVIASFDWVADQVENHEALVAVAIKEMQEAAIKAKSQMKRVQKDGQLLREQLDEARADVDKWTQRIIECTEEERALECVRRKRRAEKDSKELKERLDKHIQIERQLTKDLDTVQKRLVELRQKKNSFLARKYSSEAQKAGSLEHVGIMHEIDDIFERWDQRISQCEPLNEPIDSFAREFEETEERNELLAEYEAIMKANK